MNTNKEDNIETDSRERKTKYKEPYYCQLTSSTVKIDDLVTEEEDGEHEEEYHYYDDTEQDRPEQTCRGHMFWDRPVPPPRLAWPTDRCMPIEWNMMVSDMWGYEAMKWQSAYANTELTFRDVEDVEYDRLVYPDIPLPSNEGRVSRID